MDRSCLLNPHLNLTGVIKPVCFSCLFPKRKRYSVGWLLGKMPAEVHEDACYFREHGFEILVTRICKTPKKRDSALSDPPQEWIKEAGLPWDNATRLASGS